MYKQDKAPIFVRDYKKCMKKHWDLELLDEAMFAVVKSDEEKIPHIYNDHALTGNLQGYRQLHINGRSSSWLLRYTINDKTVYFARTGTHDELD